MTSDPRARAPGPHLVLIGLMGAGKSTVGRMVAARLGRPLVDVDAEVERRTGRSVAELFATVGEEAFRDHEQSVLAEVLASPVPAVVAAGGGAVLRPANREVMRRRGRVIWLRARAATLAERVGEGRGRPLLAGGDPAGTLRRLAAERDPAYREAADRVVDVDGLGVGVVADRVLDALGEPAA